jgi:hypothetical protein
MVCGQPAPNTVILENLANGNPQIPVDSRANLVIPQQIEKFGRV